MENEKSVMLDCLEPKDITQFPAVSQALDAPDGLLAYGGNLSVTTLKSAYEQGIFPWYEDGQPILWWSPSNRALIPTGEIHVSRSMKRFLKKQDYHLTADKAFDAVVNACAKSTGQPGRESTWITQAMKQAYTTLHQHKLAHSIEVWNKNGQLRGGLYGVFVKNIFCGESMFSRDSNTSKLALIALSRFLQANDCHYIDCQMQTAHLAKLGAQIYPRDNFIALLAELTPNQSLFGQNWSEIWQRFLQ